MKLVDIYKYIKNGLIEANVIECESECKLILNEVINKDISDVLLNGNDNINDDYLLIIKNIINRRSKGEPIQYIFNKQHFYNLELFVNENVLIPRFETEILCDYLIGKIKDNHKKISVLDLCTGSGAIAIALKKNCSNIEMYASDISEEALKIALLNASNNNTDICFFNSDLLKNINRTFDIIVSNPPYISHSIIPTLQKELDYEPILALDGGIDGLDIIRKIIIQAKNHLNDSGMLILEIGHDQSDEVIKLLKNESYTDINFIYDFNNIKRFIKGYWNKNAIR